MDGRGKVAVCINANAAARDLIARGARLAQATDAEFFVLHLDTDRDREAAHARVLEESFEFATNLGARVVHLSGRSVALATAAFATEHRITQAIFGRSALTGLKKYLYFRSIQQFAAAAPHVDLHIITHEVS